MGKRKGRPRKTAMQKILDAEERVKPAQHILDRRKMFSFVQPPERLEGRNGEIDSEVCDGIGQLCALGLLDGHGHDPLELRDKGRFWGGHYAKLMKGSAAKVGSAERHARTTHDAAALTSADLMFDRMDENLPSYERAVLLSLLVDPLIGSDPMGKEMCLWVQSLIDEALLKRGRERSLMVLPGEHERGLLAAAIRGLVILVDGALPARWERAA
jgi:hypothetical protein